MPYRYLMEARILRRESAAFRDVDRISTMDSRTLNLHIARSGDGALFYRLVQEYRVRQGWFLLYAEALKLKLAQHRTGEFPETLETGLPFRYERTKDGFRFTDSRNREVLAYPALKHTEPAEGR